MNCLGVPAEYFVRKQAESKAHVKVDAILKRLNGKVHAFREKFGNIIQNKVDQGETSFLEIHARATLLQELATDMRLSIDACKSF
mmetsp:Transcript_29111/g.43878  ORF Transcript_29111/g.43878 Transcript_29111/m.43878 type:complete len:85 (-) Transcript_29111:1955-2209(-)